MKSIILATTLMVGYTSTHEFNPSQEPFQCGFKIKPNEGDIKKIALLGQDNPLSDDSFRSEFLIGANRQYHISIKSDTIYTNTSQTEVKWRFHKDFSNSYEDFSEGKSKNFMNLNSDFFFFIVPTINGEAPKERVESSIILTLRCLEA